MIDRNELKILLLDTEWTYALAYVFPSKKPQYVSPRDFKFHQICICASWKFLHQVNVQSVKMTDDKKTFKSKKHWRKAEKIIAVKLHAVMQEADIIVAHNGDQFDLKHINGLFEKYGLGPIPEKKTIDTLKVVRKYFNYAGNDLDSLSKRYGGKGKEDKPDWKLLTDGCGREINKASRYCDKDVLELERIFLRVRPFIRRFPTLRKLGIVTQCDICQSKRLRNKGPDWDGYRQYKRILCLECGYNHKCKP